MEKIVEAVKTDIRKVSEQELKNFFEQIGEKSFRASQVREWIWEKAAVNFDDMTNISLKTRELLKQKYDFFPIEISKVLQSTDGTTKVAFALYDGQIIESVIIPAHHRLTACVSSQVGCSLACKFCATGYMGHLRNLDAAEIYDQVVKVKQLAANHYHTALTNIVFMGMGEPLLNYNNVMRAIQKITSPDGLGMSPSRITLSTSGIAKMIVKLADENPKFNLALSLHAADDVKRSKIMPINESNNLESLSEALKYYHQKTKMQVTYEYCVWQDVNDTLQDAAQLVAFTKIIPSKVNLIEYNPIAEADFVNTGKENMKKFVHFLQTHGVNVTIRQSRGKDIHAACGQLANKANQQS